MKQRDGILGIDIGSVSIGLAEVLPQGRTGRTAYAYHHGLIEPTLRRMLEAFGLDGIHAAACTASSPPFIRSAARYDSQVAVIAAARRAHPELRSILVIGGEQFTLLRFDAEGNYRGLRANSSCAAGTGSFLDQQARRLNLEGSAELSEVALGSRGAPPAIASRCSVFAKTDLIHAQQEGFSLEEICDGLCLGLARNVADTLLAGHPVPPPIVFAGGVSRNRAVTRHLEALIGATLVVDEHSHLYGAVGAALCLRQDLAGDPAGGDGRGPSLVPEELLDSTPAERSYHYPPLRLEGSAYPTFDSLSRTLYTSRRVEPAHEVEVDLYEPLEPGRTLPVYLGLDIGSTSTKAVLVGPQRNVLAGFYTRTAGRPLQAVRSVLESLDDLLGGGSVQVLGAAATGSGRKFVGRVVGADLIVDEITAHARAATELDPEIDTIIEIGGQDAKFTTLRGGRVTFCQMNTVCAAGTGSFIEEQAARLGVPLEEVSRRASSARSPLASDRCTVFMERDINHYLNRCYSVDEILAAVLHSVRENYLLKVAVESGIGRKVCFQGATAKNRALVAAFEERLGRPISVSRYCHLTGALGAALLCMEESPPGTAASTFRGLDIFREEIPVATETCTLCTNRCRIRIAEIHGERVAYGFACGRDYETRRFVNRNRSGFDPLQERQRTFQDEPAPAESAASAGAGPTAGAPAVIGLPAALHLMEELPLWKRFFRELNLPTVTSERLREGVKAGKQLAGAEFCAPVTALHGHARHLAERSAAIFLPVYLSNTLNPRDRGRLRSFCYYTQFAPALVAGLEETGISARTLMPLVRHSHRRATARELFTTLRPFLPAETGVRAVEAAYRQALRWYRSRSAELEGAFSRVLPSGDGREVRVLLIGRPYVLFSPVMNKGIPEIFAAQGVQAFFQDMIRPDPVALAEIRPLLTAVHWNFSARILESALTAAGTEGLYPVLITSFKCAPDSFTVEYFRRIMDAREKPYLILQIDEHDSSVGYETRIEAGIRAFRNHARTLPEAQAAPAAPALPVNPRVESRLRGRTLLLPNWDPLTCPLVVANLRRFGVDARLLQEDEQTIRRSLGLNTGQCIPLNAITEEYITYVQDHGLDPARCLLWMARSTLSCNIPLYPYYIRSLLEAYGRGFERSGVYVGDLSHIEISPLAALHTYFAYLFGGLLRRIGCLIRPYETEPGATDRAVAEAGGLFEEAMLGRLPMVETVKQVVGLFEGIPQKRTRRPKVAIFGDLYVRDNDVMNQGLIRVIEEAGGEVVTTPYSDYNKIIASAFFRHCLRKGKLLAYARFRSLLAMIELLEKKYYSLLGRYVGDPLPWRNPDLEQELARFHIRPEQAGESFDNVLKIARLMKAHPDLCLFVQTNPAFCCPSLVTEAMSGRIEEITGVPVVTLTYDGTGSFRNDRVIPYLKFPRNGFVAHRTNF